MVLLLFLMIGVGHLGEYFVECTSHVTRAPKWLFENKMDPFRNDTEVIQVLARPFEPYVIDALRGARATHPSHGVDIQIIDELSRRLNTPYSLLLDGVKANTMTTLAMKR